MKNILLSVGVLMALLFTSCSKDEVNNRDESASQEIVFQVANFTASGARSQNLTKEQENIVPTCSDVEATMVKLTIMDADNVATEYTLNLVGINNNTETEPLNLDEGNYRITSFVAYAEDETTAVWAAPMMGSYYQTLWNLKGVNELPFSIVAFDKVKVEVDVLCYEPYDYQNFGFGWFAFSQTKVNTICFFGDICTEFYEQWHTLEGSSYVGQSYNGYDFPAIFSVEVFNEAGVLVNDPNVNSNISWMGTGSPLCIEYPNRIGVDETFNYKISVALPDGTTEVIHTSTFNDTAIASTDGTGGFGGKDGVFTFGAGCTNDGNDINVELTKYDFTPTTPVAIGDYVNGGVVFYIAETPTDLDGDGDLDKGLVCAITDQKRSVWFNGTYSDIGSTGSAIGTGASNTTAIIASQGTPLTNYAAEVARAYNIGGNNVWFLPSLDELTQINVHMAIINNTSVAYQGTPLQFNGGYYWSSTQIDSNNAISKLFNGGSTSTYNDKGYDWYVRAIRAF